MPVVRPEPVPEDPDEYRMSFGEHLEELRTRLVLGLAGFVVAFIFCLMVVRDWVFQFLCRPLLDVMQQYDLNPMLFDRTGSDAFSTYLKLSAIAAVIIASPWLLWQLWMFVAAGLYPHERKTVTRFIPVFTLLLLSGVAFAFYVVLPMTLQFLIYFSTSIKLPEPYEPRTSIALPTSMPTVPFLDGDPPQPIGEGVIWFNRPQRKLKMAIEGRVRVIQYVSENLVTPQIQLDEYTSMLLMLLLTFGVSFQTPLAVLLLVRVGIADLQDLKNMRRMVYFALVILAAVITPGDVFTATIALVIPLIGLYEFGLILARPPKLAEATAVDETPPGT
jgi:sec-independent protein translocase protein TatC